MTVNISPKLILKYNESGNLSHRCFPNTLLTALPQGRFRASAFKVMDKQRWGILMIACCTATAHSPIKS